MTNEQTLDPICYVCGYPVAPTQPQAQSTVLQDGEYVVITRHLSCEPVATEG